jgi:hypothetical protein
MSSGKNYLYVVMFHIFPYYRLPEGTHFLNGNFQEGNREISQDSGMLVHSRIRNPGS